MLFQPYFDIARQAFVKLSIDFALKAQPELLWTTRKYW